MHRHSAEAIKESSRKRFVSQEDKDRYDSYENDMISIESSYTKDEIDSKVEILSSNVESVSITKFPHKVENTMNSYIKNLEILGNTTQDKNKLEIITSVGELQEDGTYKITVKTTGKNLVDKSKSIYPYIILNNGDVVEGSEYERIVTDFIPVKPNTTYVMNEYDVNHTRNAYYDKNFRFICSDFTKVTTSPSNAAYIRCMYKKCEKYQIEEGTLSTEYQEYIEDTRDIYLPFQLHGLDNTLDKLYIRDDGMLCVDKWFKEHEFGNDTKILIDPLASGIYNPDRDTYKLVIHIPIKGYDDIKVHRQYLSISSHYLFEVSVTDTKHFFVESYNGLMAGIDKPVYCVVYEEKSKIDSWNGDTVKIKAENYIKSLGLKVIFSLVEPEVIELGHIDDLSLRTNSTTMVNVIGGEKPSKVNFKVSKSIPDTIVLNRGKIHSLADEVKELQNLTSGEVLKGELNRRAISFDSNEGYLDDFEISGKSVANLNVYLGGVYGDHSNELKNKFSAEINQTSKAVRFTALEDGASTLINNSHQFMYAGFRWQHRTHIKPNTYYKLTYNVESNIFTKGKIYTWSSLRTGDSQQIASNDSTPIFDRGKKTVIIKTKPIIPNRLDSTDIFISIRCTDFNRNEYVRVTVESFIELGTDDSVGEYILDAVYTGIESVGSKNNTINIISNNKNLISFSNFNKNNIDDFYIKNDITINEINCNDIILSSNTSNDNYIIFDPSKEMFKHLQPNKKYRICWSVDVLSTNPSYSCIYMLKFKNNDKFNTTPYEVIHGKTNLINNNFLDFIVEEDCVPTLRFDIRGTNTKIRIYDIILISLDDENEEYKSINKIDYKFVEPKRYTKTINLSNYGIEGGLKSLPDGTCDRIFKSNDKYYLEQRVGRRILNGNENWKLISVDVTISDTTNLFCNYTYIPDVIRQLNNVNVIFDKFISRYVWGVNKDNVAGFINRSTSDINGGHVYFRVNKSDFPNVESFKSWMTDNNIEVLYELETPIVVELKEDLDMISHEGKTYLSVLSDCINPNVKFNRPSVLQDTIKVLMNKVKRLEDKEIALNNLMLKSIYSGESAKYDISIALRTTNVNYIDNDLFELLTKVILVGPNNYDREELEEKIDFFTLIDKLDYDMADVLFELIDNQHSNYIE